jgi:hypothetical protein
LLPEGQEVAVEVGPEAVNFDQVVKGDVVTISVIEEVVIGMADADAPVENVVARGRAPVGATPGAAAMSKIRLTTTVTEIDREARTATLEFADGSTRVFDVRPDVDLERRRVGEKVYFQVTDELSIDVWKD